MVRLLLLEPGPPLSSVRMVLRLASRFSGAGGAIVGSATTELVALVGKLCLLVELDRGPVMRLMLFDLVDCICGRVSTFPDAVVGEDTSVKAMVDIEFVVMVAFVSTRERDDTEGRELWPGAIDDLLEATSDVCPEPSLISFASFGMVLVGLPPPTASRNRLYKPLRPFCTNSPAPGLFSKAGIPSGGGAKSLKVVKDSHRLADV